MYDQLDDRGVPTTRGMPRAVQIAVLIGIAVIFAMGGYTIVMSGYGHRWPSTKSLRIPLNGSYQH